MKISLSTIDDICNSYVRIYDFKEELLIDEQVNTHAYIEFVKKYSNLEVMEIRCNKQCGCIDIFLWSLRSEIEEEEYE